MPEETADQDSAQAERNDELLSAVRRWWHGIEAEIDQRAVIEKLRSEAYWTPRYAFLVAMSAGIAVLGLLLSSPAVVIGAMLLSPLMGPIMGCGFALAIGDIRWLRTSSFALAMGVLVAVLFCTIIVMLSPLQAMTSEIAARTRPNLFDLLIALFSALAGAYAMIRGREGTIVGVAIATALMPPLAVVGYGLGVGNWSVFSGALFLFVTNLLTIALTAAAMARLYGFRSYLSAGQSIAQTIAIAFAFIVLAIPLGFSLQRIAWEANATRQAEVVIEEQFPNMARVSQVEIDFAASPVQVTASVLTPEIVHGVNERVVSALGRRLDRPISASVTQFEVGTEEDADDAELALARASAEANATREERSLIAVRLALVAGVEESDVTIDGSARRAIVHAVPIHGADLAVYRELEQRVTNLEDGWEIRLIPPLVPLAPVEIDGGEPSDAGQRNLNLAIWAARRRNMQLSLSGSESAVEVVAERISRSGIGYSVGDQDAQAGTVFLAWAETMPN